MPTYLLNLLNQHNSQLVEVSEHTTNNTNNRLIIVIDGKKYTVVRQTLISTQNITIGMIPNLFKSGVPVCVELRSESWNKKMCLICFHQIPEIPRPLHFYESSRIPQLNFSVCVFKEDLISMFPAKNRDDCSQSIALGYFNVMSFIQEFRQISSTEFRIQILWKMFVHSLCKIGYFDFFDYNHFMSIVFKLFQRMFSFNEKRLQVRPGVLKELFFSFIQRLLMKNSWFLICGELIRTVRSSTLIDLFSKGKYPPNLHFIDKERNLVGMSILSQKENEFTIEFLLVLLQNPDAIYIGSEINAGCPDWRPDISEPCDEDDINCDDGPLVRSFSYNEPRCIKQGIILFGNQTLILFKLGSSITVIQRKNGTFEYFNIYLLVLRHALDVNDILYEWTIQFTCFPYVGSTHLREGMTKCGVFPIIEGTATVEQIREVLFDSDFGVVLQELHQKLEGFRERLREHYSIEVKEQSPAPASTQEWIEDQFDSRLESIRNNRFIKDFLRFFTPVLEQLQERRDLTPEIIEILQFLKELFAFFTPDPLDM